MKLTVEVTSVAKINIHEATSILKVEGGFCLDSYGDIQDPQQLLCNVDYIVAICGVVEIINPLPVMVITYE